MAQSILQFMEQTASIPIMIFTGTFLKVRFVGLVIASTFGLLNGEVSLEVKEPAHPI